MQSHTVPPNYNPALRGNLKVPIPHTSYTQKLVMSFPKKIKKIHGSKGCSTTPSVIDVAQVPIDSRHHIPEHFQSAHNPKAHGLFYRHLLCSLSKHALLSLPAVLRDSMLSMSLFKYEVLI